MPSHSPQSLSDKDTSLRTIKAHGAGTGLQQMKRTTLSVSMAWTDMPNGILASMIGSLRTRSDDTNFRMVISKMFIDAVCLRYKPELGSTGMPISEKQRQSWSAQ